MTNQQTIYANEFKPNGRPGIEPEIGPPKGPGSLTDLPSARPLWGNESSVVKIPQAPYTDAIKEEVVQLLKMGQRVNEIAALLRVPPSLVYRLRNHCVEISQSEKDTDVVIDRRRLYDEAFKRDAIRQIQQGIPIIQISQTLGVSTVTLHKWKKEVQLEAPSADQPFLDIIAQLQRQLRETQEERDALKKTLTILLRS